MKKKEVKSIPDQETVFKEAQNNITQNSTLMRKAIGDNKFQSIIKYAIKIIAELKSSLLSPQNYYIICIFNKHFSYADIRCS